MQLVTGGVVDAVGAVFDFAAVVGVFNIFPLGVDPQTAQTFAFLGQLLRHFIAYRIHDDINVL